MALRRLAGGFVFPEGLRWFAGALWLSDIHAHRVYRVSESGSVTIIAELDDRPSGLGFLPDGTPVVVAMTSRRLLRLCDTGPVVHADLSPWCDGFLNDMVIDAHGNAYVGARNASGDTVLLVHADGRVELGADRMQSPNGSVVSADGGTLIVAETSAARLSAFDIGEDGRLHGRRVFAEVPGRHPDGMAIDANGEVWFGSPITHEFVRVRDGGEVTATIETPGCWAIACAMGGVDGDVLYAVTGRNSVENILRVIADPTLDHTSDAEGWLEVATMRSSLGVSILRQRNTTEDQPTEAHAVITTAERCPCGSPSYASCCGRLHRGDTDGVTAGQVMRARYSAFARHDAAYLLRSWHPTTRPMHIVFDPNLHWLRLEIVDTTGGNLLDTEGAVEFDAHHQQGTRRGVLHERSLFLRHEHRWVYVGPVAAHIG